jgi:hypothetical protein
VQLRKQAHEAWEVWLGLAGPWRQWATCLTLLGPELPESRAIAPLGERGETFSREKRTRSGAADSRGAAADARTASDGNEWPSSPEERSTLAGTPGGAAPPALFVLDLEPSVGVRLVAQWALAGLARPVLMIGRWPYPLAVLPARPLVDVLIAEAGRLRDVPLEHARSLAIVLDAERDTSLPRRPAGDPRVDNRYALFPDHLPPARSLLDAGIQRVVDIRHGGTISAPLSTIVYPAYSAGGLTIEHLTS